MGAIVEQHLTTLTKSVQAIFDEQIAVRSGLSGFFTRKRSTDTYVSVVVRRGTDFIAVDVARQGEGNKNKISKATERLYSPPIYEEEYDLKKNDLYRHNIMRAGNVANKAVNRAILEDAVKGVSENRNKIERSILKQQLQALQTGIIELKNGDNIDFNRKAASIVDLGAGNYWDQAGSDPIKDLEDGMTFLREQGRSASGDVNVIMRRDAFRAFITNQKVIDGADVRRINRVNIDAPNFDGVTGMAFQGTIATVDFNIMLWTYNEFYTDPATGLTRYYQDYDKVIMLPNDFRGDINFGGIETSRESTVSGVRAKIPQIVETEFLLRSYYEDRSVSSTLATISRPLVVPVTIDKTYTLKVLA